MKLKKNKNDEKKNSTDDGRTAVCDGDEPCGLCQRGDGGSDSMQSTNNLPVEFYKLEVELP